MEPRADKQQTVVVGGKKHGLVLAKACANFNRLFSYMQSKVNKQSRSQTQFRHDAKIALCVLCERYILVKAFVSAIELVKGVHYTGMIHHH